jgi:hypothetical protein
MAWIDMTAPARRPSSFRSQATWLPSPTGKPGDHDLEGAAQRVARLLGGVDGRDHGGLGRGVEGADRGGVGALVHASLEEVGQVVGVRASTSPDDRT